jgi:hypothetical protein
MLGRRSALTGTTAFVSEMCEFACFSGATQRYIKRSIDVGVRQCDDTVKRWARSHQEAASIAEQERAYRVIALIRNSIPDDLDPDATETVLGPLIHLSLFDLNQGKLPDFGSYRFLYERLLGRHKAVAAKRIHSRSRSSTNSSRTAPGAAAIAPGIRRHGARLVGSRGQPSFPEMD